MLRLVQQIILLLRVCAASDTMKEYEGDTRGMIMAAVEMATRWEHEVTAIGVRHRNVLDAFADAFPQASTSSSSIRFLSRNYTAVTPA